MTRDTAAPGATLVLPGRGGLARAALAAEGVLARLVDATGALLVLAEVALLLAGVVARYVLSAPLIWSDELASILFLWLAMVGAASAYHRGQHMRLTVLAGRASPPVRAALDVVASAACCALMVVLCGPAIETVQDQAAVVTPAMEIPDSWRVAALPVAFAVMLTFSALRLARTGRPLTVAASLLVAALAAAAVIWAGPVLRPLGNLNLVLFFVLGVGAAVFAGVPIGFVFGLATAFYLALATRVPLSVVVGRVEDGIGNLVLLAVPLFVFLGALIEMNGMARAMVRFLASLLGHVRGGLSYVLLGAIYLVSGIAGAKAADMAAVAPVLFPEMRSRGAKPGDLIALLAASGAMSETIPPSLVLITLGTVTSVSISALFTGGLLPGVVLALALAAVVRLRYRNDDLSHVRRADRREVGASLLAALPALMLPLLIRFAVVEGIATATEVSTVGIAYAAIVGRLMFRRIGPARLYAALVDTASLSGAILLIIGTATAMAWALTQSGFSGQLAAAMAGLPGGAVTFMAISIVVFIVLGSVLEGIPAVVLFGPLMFPIARGLHVNEVHYAIVVVLAMGIGLFAPPFGVGYYTACAIGRVDPAEGMRPILGYMLALAAGLAVVAAVPWLTTGFL